METYVEGRTEINKVSQNEIKPSSNVNISEKYYNYLEKNGHRELLIKYSGLKVISNNLYNSRGSEYARLQRHALSNLAKEIYDYEEFHCLKNLKRNLNV